MRFFSFKSKQHVHKITKKIWGTQISQKKKKNLDKEQQIGKLTFLDFKCYCKLTIINRVWSWHNGIGIDILINGLKLRIQINPYIYGQLIFDNIPRQFNKGIYCLLQMVRPSIYTHEKNRERKRIKRKKTKQKRKIWTSVSHKM